MHYDLVPGLVIFELVLSRSIMKWPVHLELVRGQIIHYLVIHWSMLSVDPRLFWRKLILWQFAFVGSSPASLTLLTFSRNLLYQHPWSLMRNSNRRIVAMLLSTWYHRTIKKVSTLKEEEGKKKMPTLLPMQCFFCCVSSFWPLFLEWSGSAL